MVNKNPFVPVCPVCLNRLRFCQCFSPIKVDVVIDQRGNTEIKATTLESRGGARPSYALTYPIVKASLGVREERGRATGTHDV